jgi:hypothetical protein
MSNLAKYLLIAPLLVACAQTDAEPIPQPNTVLAEASPDLARPQPEMPVCAHCGADILTGQAGIYDDELSMIINSTYVGHIDDVELVVYTSSSKYNLGFDPSVIDDLNDPLIYETIVMLDINDAQRLLLVFTLDDESVAYEPVTIES